MQGEKGERREVGFSENTAAGLAIEGDLCYNVSQCERRCSMRSLSVIMAVGLSALLTSCGVGEVKRSVDEKAERIGEVIDEKAEKLGEVIDEQAEKVGEAIDEKLEPYSTEDRSPQGLKNRKLYFRNVRTTRDDYAEAVMECFKNKDSGTLTQYFADKSAETQDLKAQIEAAFEFMNNEDIISYGEIRNTGSSKIYGREGTSMLSQGFEVIDVVTAGDTYRIFIGCMLIYEDDPSEVGIQKMIVSDSEYDIEEYLEYEKKTFKTEPYEHMVYIGEYLDSWFKC